MGVGFEVLADEFSLAAPFLPMSIYFLSDCGDQSAEARDERSHCETVVTYDHCWAPHSNLASLDRLVQANVRSSLMGRGDDVQACLHGSRSVIAIDNWARGFRAKETCKAAASVVSVDLK